VSTSVLPLERPEAAEPWLHPLPQRSVRTSLVTRARQQLKQHARSVVIIGLLVVLAAVVHGVNMLHSPRPFEDEGTYVAQAFAVQKFGRLSFYTYWYDHPPLGWLLLAAWNELASLIFPHASVFGLDRTAMLVVHLCSCVLLWVLARRLHLSRWASALAVLVFTLSPLGFYWQREVLLDNIGTPLLLLGWVLALSPRRRLIAYAASAAALAGAMLVKETNALFVPFVALSLWQATARLTPRQANRSRSAIRAADRHHRALIVALAASIFMGTVSLYFLYAVIKGELLPGKGHVSLLGSLAWQFFGRPGRGSILDPHSLVRVAVDGWVRLDWPLLAGALLLAPFAYRSRRLRPALLLLLILLAVPLRGGYLPAPYPIGLIWPAALVIAGGAEAIVGWASTSKSVVRSVTLGVVALVGASVLLINAWNGDRPPLLRDQATQYQLAAQWVDSHVAPGSVVLADNVTWIDLVQRGWDWNQVVWYPKFDLDPAVVRRYPQGWRQVNFVIVTPPAINALDQATEPRVFDAIAHSKTVATFGDIQIRAIGPSGQ